MGAPSEITPWVPALLVAGRDRLPVTSTVAPDWDTTESITVDAPLKTGR
jgi:hypothetical protein